MTKDNMSAQGGKTKNMISVTEARKNIFAITESVQKPDTHYTLTERGTPRAVILSVERFEKMLKSKNGFALADGNGNSYASQFPKFPGTLIIRDESRIVYLSAKDQEMKAREEGLIKAQLYVELIEICKFPLHLVELARYVRIGKKQSRRYIEADAIVNDHNGNVKMIFEVGNFADYEKNMDIVVEELFDLADSLSWVKKPQFLVYFSRKYVGGEVKKKILVVEYTKFNTFSAWKKAGRPGTDRIPRFE